MNRTSITRWALLASVMTASSALNSYAQETPRTGGLQPRPEVESQSEVQQHRLSTILESRIMIQGDQVVGKAVDVVLSNGGCIEYIVATHEDRYYVVPYAATQVRDADRVVFVDVAPAQFERVQYFNANAWPTFSPAYRQNVFQTFGVNINIDRDRGDRRALRPDYNDRNTDRNRNENDRNPADRDRPNANPDRPRNDADSPNPRTPRENRPDAGERPENSPRPGAKPGDRNDPEPRPRNPMINPQDPAPAPRSGSDKPGQAAPQNPIPAAPQPGASAPGNSGNTPAVTPPAAGSNRAPEATPPAPAPKPAPQRP